MVQNYGDSIMVALLPTTSDWCQQSMPHLTLLYGGKVGDVKGSVYDELLRAVIDIASSSAPVTLEVMGEDVFGEDEKVDVLLLRTTPVLLQMRRRVEAYNGSQFTDFKPHVTVGPEGSMADEIPGSITFDRILLSWGVDAKIYRLL
jgi:2'-5' RNA ligase